MSTEQRNAYDHYLRGTYLFITLPPLERSPDHIGTSIAPLYKQNIIDYNTALLKHTERFATAHRDVNILTFDAHAWFNEILDTAEDYGFTNITGYEHGRLQFDKSDECSDASMLRFCECTDPTFFWFNTGHPTAHVHRLLAGAIESELKRASVF
uniref:Zn(2)-C6 fungal-type domain-containing protein n=1 Tax=Ganoderma boninense TaxID=34458 RepID=A0A5K1K6Q6_9APHY|nr:Zn(2)-C6 fungal-type domain-containing protein [Ganoderma boninense]